MSMGQLVDEPGRGAHRGRRDAEVGERVPGVAVGAVLADDDVGPERVGEIGQELADRAEPGLSPRCTARAGR